MLNRTTLATVLFTASAFAAPTVPVVPREAGPVIRSYDAIYDVRLIEASASTGPRAAIGSLDLRLIETCTGWETRSRVVMDLAFRDGTTLTNERIFWSTESRDGRAYEFAVKTVKGGVPVEAFKGSARLSK